MCINSTYNEIKKYCTDKNITFYFINYPLSLDKYKDLPSKSSTKMLLIPNHKIAFIEFSDSKEYFDIFVDDIIEDLGYLSDKYNYKNILGRPRIWKDKLIKRIHISEIKKIEYFIDSLFIDNAIDQRNANLLISLFLGSINDINNFDINLPNNILDTSKQRVFLFDQEQLKFIYENQTKKIVRIQGIAGSGKTTLLFYKLKNIYTEHNDAKIAFICNTKLLIKNLRNDIYSFFDFLNVKNQRYLDKNLYCFKPCGSEYKPQSGIYSFICQNCDIPFTAQNNYTDFDKLCCDALNNLKDKNKILFDYIFIDESQYFTQSFINLCAKVTRYNIFVAGDIFQNITNKNVLREIKPDFLLKKCYQTPTHTFMFAQCLGLGLFDKNNLYDLDDHEFEIGGYNCQKEENESGTNYYLTRQNLDIFNWLKDYQSIIIQTIDGNFYQSVSDKIEQIILEIKAENPTVKPDDIAIIFADPKDKDDIYMCSNILSIQLPKNTGFEVNLAYISNKKICNTIFINHIDNSRGINFPFVICITENIENSYINSLYIALTRSSLRSYFIISNNTPLVNKINDCLKSITESNKIFIQKSNSKLLSGSANINKLKNKQALPEIIQTAIEQRSIDDNMKNEITKKLINIFHDIKDFNESDINKFIDMLIKIQYAK